MQKFPLALERVKKIGWYNMFERIAEHRVEVTKAFCQGFKGSRVGIGGLSFIVTEETISHAQNLSKNTRRYVENMNTKSSFFLSSKINQYYFIIFLRRPILDPKIPLIFHMSWVHLLSLIFRP